jgi:hypothetical protein
MTSMFFDHVQPEGRKQTFGFSVTRRTPSIMKAFEYDFCKPGENDRTIEEGVYYYPHEIGLAAKKSY